MSFNLYFCPPDAIIFQTYSLLSKIENLNKNIIPILHSVFRLPRVPTRYFPRGFSLSFPLSFPPLHLLQHPSSNNRRSFHSQNTLSQTNFFKSNSRKYFPITKPKPSFWTDTSTHRSSSSTSQRAQRIYQTNIIFDFIKNH